MRAVVVLFSFLSSALAYSISVPNANQGWTNQGVQPLDWQRVATDRLNFSVLLVNQEKAGFTPQLLGSAIDGTLGKTGCNPPQGGWPTGSGFQVNFVENATALNSILAQSNMFNITQSTATATDTTSATKSSATNSAKNGTSSNTISIKFGRLLPVWFILLGLAIL